MAKGALCLSCRLSSSRLGLAYRACGVPCVAPEDDTSRAQGCTLANGRDEVHLCRKRDGHWGRLRPQDERNRWGGQAPACFNLLNSQLYPPFTSRQRLICFLFKCLSPFPPHFWASVSQAKAHLSLGAAIKMDSKVRRPGPQSQLCSGFAGKLWANFSASLCLNCSHLKNGDNDVALSGYRENDLMECGAANKLQT